MNLTDEQWEVIAPVLPERPVCREGGRPPSDCRAVLNGILWVMRTGSPWRQLPHEFPSRHVCSRHFREWQQTGVLESVLRALDEDLEYRTGLESRRFHTMCTHNSAWSLILVVADSASPALPDAVGLLWQEPVAKARAEAGFDPIECASDAPGALPTAPGTGRILIQGY